MLEERPDGHPGPKVTGPKDIAARIWAKSYKAAIVGRRGTSSRQMTKNFNQPSPLHPTGATVERKQRLPFY